MEQCFNSNANSITQCGNINGFNQCSTCLKRPRLIKLLENAMDYPLVIVCAGAGYGKTRAVHSFLQQYEATTIWLQISERDNIATRFWESYTSVVSLSLPETGARLIEIGFPETDEEFAKYTSVMREVAALPGKHIRVFDDFHLLHDPTVLSFFERAVNMIPSNVTLLLIARNTPDLNLVGMMMREQVYTLQENTLCFSEDEVAEYFSQLKLPVPARDVRHIYDDTQGWAFAVNLIGRSLGKEQKYERHALEAMKKNIFRLIEAEITGTVSESLWRFLLRISLIDHLAASLIRELAKDDMLIDEMELVNAYIRYDFHLDAYLIHHLFLDYLRANQEKFLTDTERKETYQTAGAWCDANGYHTDALSYYEKSCDFDAIMRKISTFNVQMPPDMARYALDILDRAPESVKSGNAIFPGLHIRLKANLGEINEETMALAQSYAEDYEARPESTEKNHALSKIYANWAIMRMLMCTYTDVYDFDDYYSKMGTYFNKKPFQTITKFNIIPISTWASLVGTSRAGAQEEYINALSRSIPDIAAMGNGCFVGLDDLARGELCFCRGEFNDAEKHLKQSVDKAQACDQYITYNRALAYLMRIAFFRGDFAAVNRWLKKMELLLNEENHGVRFTMYDIALSFYHLSLGQPEQIPEWLKSDFSPYTHPSFIENYANRIKALYHYQTRQYSTLLAFIENNMQQSILFSKIELKVLEALSLYNLKRRSEAIASLTEAYNLAKPNDIVALFTQYSKAMRTLTAAALRDDACEIPKQWLEVINRKASAFAKRQAHMITEYRAANNLDEEISLSKRETEILKDLSQGLSRTETAVSQNISPNTVKMTINIIYEKLHANNLADAIRIAVDNRII